MCIRYYSMWVLLREMAQCLALKKFYVEIIINVIWEYIIGINQYLQ